jgi:hypothetical protein
MLKMKLSEINCNNASSLDDIQGRGTVDKNGDNKGIDKKKVACMQKYYLDKEGNKKPANELKRMIKKYYEQYEDDEDFYKALCECCQLKLKGFVDFEGANEWEKLYACLESKGFDKV